MASYGLIMNQIALDSEFYVWGSGQDIRKYNGTSWEYYDHTNSAVPSGSPYFLDTRSIDIDNEDVLWAGVAQGPTSGLNEFAVFSMDIKDVSVGNKWKFSDLGVFDQPQEISLVYACPFGDDVLVFSTPLNGIGGTGASGYTEVSGVTGGRLFYYLKTIDKWRETVPGYKWPHIYDIKAKGYDGNDYFYYVATSEGLYIMPEGSQEIQYLNGTGEIIEQVEVYNTKTSGILSDNIHSLDLDEDGNLWIGTDLGISFFDGKKFWNYSFEDYLGYNAPATKIISRPNGHVYFTLGDGELQQGTGFWHFNGSTFDQFDTSNNSIKMTNNNVLDLKLIKHNTKQGDTTLYENSLWVLCYNDLAYFNYDQPHIYGSSKYAGATGWNFTYFNDYELPIAISLPKVNKYTWTYPEWMVYQDEYLVNRFPGLDERNLFLTTRLSDIADGKAGKQAYWNNWPIESFEETQIGNSINSPYFQDQITLLQLSPPGSGGIYVGDITITCSTTIKTRNGTKYYIGGYLTGNVLATFGYRNRYQGEPATLRNLNPTLGGVCNSLSYPSYSQDYGTMGFVVCYNEYGEVEAIAPFRGYKTYVQDIAPSEDGNFVAVSGYFSRFIEDGPYIWDSLEGENALRGGPTGAPAGLTNINYYNEHSTEYPWIGGGNSIAGSGDWLYATADPPTFGGFGIGFENNQVLEEIIWFSFNYNDTVPDNQTGLLRSLVTGNSITITGVSSYLIESIQSVPGYTGLKYNVKYASGAKGSLPQSIGDTFTFTFYDYASDVFPLVRLLRSRTSSWNTNSWINDSPFVAKIGRDLGGVTSFSGLGSNSDYHSDVRKSYRGLGFRHFPAIYASIGTDIKESKVDVTKYSIDLSLKSQVDLRLNGRNPGDMSTLKNLWNRSNDGYYTSDKILGTTYPISQSTAWWGDSVLSYVRLLSDDLSLAATITSATYQTFPQGTKIRATRFLSSTKSMQNDTSTIITGVSSTSFSMAGIDFINIYGGSYYEQFYLLVDRNGIGLTGGYLEGSAGTIQLPKATNDQSVYYITTEFSASGSYFGNDFIADSNTGTYFLTATITEQGTPKSFYKTFVDQPSASLYLLDVGLSGSDQYYIAYRNSASVALPLYNVVKTDMNGTILSNINFGNAAINSFATTSDADGSIFMSGYYTNYTGITGDSYIYLPPNSGFSLLSKRYKPELGLNMGQIISRPGSGAWTWCDVHSADSGMKIPLMTTVVFNNYASNLYGKKNNKWILGNSITGEEILNVKNTPYFIYTFTTSGNYTIYNSVEDAAGNVYIKTNPGYIEVIDHKQKNPDDKRPDSVDSFDYGEPDVFPGRDYQAAKLAKDLAEEESSILSDNIIPFGVGFTVYNNPDATFRKDV
jgi:hypothetical protein